MIGEQNDIIADTNRELESAIYEIKSQNATIQLLEQENRDLLKSLKVLRK